MDLAQLQLLLLEQLTYDDLTLREAVRTLKTACNCYRRAQTEPDCDHWREVSRLSLELIDAGPQEIYSRLDDASPRDLLAALEVVSDAAGLRSTKPRLELNSVLEERLQKLNLL